MSDDDKLLIKDHEYDGIRELNNPLPGWWLATFYITIIFSVIYYAYYTFLGGPDSDERLQRNMAVIMEEREAARGTQEVKSEEYFIALLDNEEVLAAGQAEYIAKCLACHGDKGQGLIGPNMTDDYWIHGDGSVTSILHIGKVGVPEKGMPPWEGVIPEETLEAVAVYIYSLHGTNPPGARPPQGEKVERK